MRKNSYITITDQFCGAGGSSQGARNAGTKLKGGLEIKLAMNHWKLAIETHNTNFPDTQHACTDVSACDPRRYPSTDILITSPECTNHSLAKGQKQVKAQLDLYDQGTLDPAAERSRATMWDVCRFAEYHQYNAIIVENVVDARKWVMFPAWLQAMHALGYNHECVYLNSMFCYPTPQSRDRMYIVFWKKGNKKPNLNFTPPAYCADCGKDVRAVQTWKKPEAHWGKYKQQYIYSCPVHGKPVQPYYYAAFNCIDWSDPGKRIGDRAKPLSPNTVKRIQYGLDKYGKQHLILHAAYGAEARGVVRSIHEPAFTQTTFETQAFVINDQHSTGIEFRVKGMDDYLSCVTTVPNMKLITPFIIKGEHTLQEGYVKAANDALQTQTVRQSMALVTPMLVELNRTGKSKPVTEPTSTFTAGGVNHGLVTGEAWNSFITAYYGGSHCTKHITDEVGTISTLDRQSLVNAPSANIEDCYYRMLKPHEIKGAMAFDQDYIVLGKAKDQVKQLGNAVTPPAMEWLVGQVIETLM